MKKYFKNNKIISVLLLIIWAIFIFVMSSFNSDASSAQSNIIVEFIANVFRIENIETLGLIIRKLAHFTEYFILGLLICNVFKVYDKKIYLGIIMGLLYAFSDEVHQLFVSGRYFSLIDVLIDFIGSIFGVLFYLKFSKKIIKLNICK